MARKNFEQMLLDELEMGKPTCFPKWYAAPNPPYYGVYDVGQDLRNTTRFNRQDLYSVEYYRQPIWMPPAFVLPNYEQIYFVRRNNKRFSNYKYYLPKERRSHAEKKFYRQEDVRNCRGERGKTPEYQPQLERRYQEGWNRDGSHFQISRDDRSASYVSYRNSNFDLFPDNMMMEQRVQNANQMVENRNPSLECLPIHECLSQTGYNKHKKIVRADLEKCNHKTSDLEMQNDEDPVSKTTESSQYPESGNFHNNNESWYCPEEQQQIVDMLKEVNLRHDRQLKRDILLSLNENTHSADSISGTKDSPSSISSDDEEDNINILLHPGCMPSIPETEEKYDEEFKSEYCENTPSHFFEEFQSIFTGSPEKKIINTIIKKSSHVEEDDELENKGTIITDDDKNAVKSVLDFEHVDDLTEKSYDNIKNIQSSVKGSRADASEDRCSIITGKQNASLPEDFSLNKCIRDIKMVENDDYLPLFNNNPSSYNYLDETESDDNSSLASSSKSENKPISQKDLQAMVPRNYEVLRMNDSFNRTKCTNDDYHIIPSENDVDSHKNNRTKYKKNLNHIFKNTSHKSLSKQKYDNDALTEKFFKERTENLCNSTPRTLKLPPTLNKINVSTPRTSNESNIQKILNEVTNMEETRISQDTNYKNLQNSRDTYKNEHGLSVSEPFLSSKMNHEYKRISISEIFSDAKLAKSECRSTFAHNRIAHLKDLNTNIKDLSPSDHLKLILGIGQKNENNKSVCQDASNDSTKRETLNIFQGNNIQKTSSIGQESEITLKNPQEQNSPTSQHCMPIHISTENNPRNAIFKENHPNIPAVVTNVDISKNRRSAEKSNTFDKNSNNSIDLNKCVSKNNIDSLIKHKMKHRNRKGSHKSESFSDQKLPSTVNIPEQKTGENCFTQSNTVEFSENFLKCNQKVNHDFGIKFCKSFLKSEKNSEPLFKENSRKKSETKKLKLPVSKYSQGKKSVKNNPKFLNEGGPYMANNSEKSYNEKYSTTKCNISSSNSKKLYLYPDHKKTVGNVESFLDDNCSRLLSIVEKHDDKVERVHSKQNYLNYQITNSKHCLRKKGNKISESSTNKDGLSKRNVEDKLVPSMDFKQNVSKSYDDNSKYSHIKTFNNDSGFSAKYDGLQSVHDQDDDEKLLSVSNKTLSSPKTRKKIKIKQKEKVINAYENQSKYEQYDPTKRSNEMDASLKESFCIHNHCKRNDVIATKDSQDERSRDPVNAVTTKDDLHNSRRNSDKYPNSKHERNKELLGHSFAEKSATFKDISALPASDKHSPIFNEQCPSNSVQEKILYTLPKFRRFKNNKVISDSGADKNVLNSNLCHEIVNEYREEHSDIANVCPVPANSSAVNSVHKFRNTEQNMIEKIKKFTSSQKFEFTSEKEYRKSNEKNFSRLQHAYFSHSFADMASDNFVLDTAHIKITTTNDKIVNSLNNVKPYSLKKMRKIKIGDFLKRLVLSNCQKANVIYPEMLSSSISTSKTCKTKRVLEPPHTDSIKVLTVIPEVINAYKRNKNFLKINPMLDLPFDFYISDFLSEFYFVRFHPKVKNVIELSLSSIINENVLHVLPLILNVVFHFTVFHLPWNHDNIKKLLKFVGPALESECEFRMLSSKETEREAHFDEILNCWNILSACVNRKEISVM